MSKKIIVKENLDTGGVVLRNYLRGEELSESMYFYDETELKTFAYLLHRMIDANANEICME